MSHFRFRFRFWWLGPLKARWSLALALAMPAAASAEYRGLEAGALMQMCRGADKARALSVMCHNYLNGYLDAAHHFNPRPGFCLQPGDKEKLPDGLVLWLARHADKQRLPASQAMELALKELYPCKGRLWR